MRKLSKILVLVLSVALLLCAFAMLATANDEEAAWEADPAIFARVYDADGNFVKNLAAWADVSGLLWGNSNAFDGAVVKLYKDVILDGSGGHAFGLWPGSYGVTVDLNGHTVTANAKASDRNAVVEVFSNKASSGNTNVYPQNIPLPVKFTLKNGTIVSGAVNFLTTQNGDVSTEVKSEVIFENLDITNGATDCFIKATSGDTEFTFNNCTINYTGAASFFYGAGASVSNVLNFNGCDITTKGVFKSNGLKAGSSANFTDVTYNYIGTNNWGGSIWVNTGYTFSATNSEIYANNLVAEPTDFMANTNLNQSGAGLFWTIKDCLVKLDGCYIETSGAVFMDNGDGNAPVGNADGDIVIANNCYIAQTNPNTDLAFVKGYKSGGNDISQGNFRFTGCTLKAAYRFAGQNSSPSVGGSRVKYYLTDTDVYMGPKVWPQNAGLVSGMTPVICEGQCNFSVNRYFDITTADATLFQLSLGSRLAKLPENMSFVTLPQGASIVLDPSGSTEFPYVVTDDATLNDGVDYSYTADFSDFAFTDYTFKPATINVASGTANQTTSFQITTGKNSDKDGLPVRPETFANMFSPNHGKVETPANGANNYFKYTVLAATDAADAETFNAGNIESSVVFGIPNPVACMDYRAAIVDFDIKADSEKGFADIKLSLACLNNSVTQGITIDNEGVVSVSGGAMSLGLNAVLSADEWNHITVEIIPSQNLACWYVNGLPVAMTTVATSANDFFVGVKAAVATNTDLVVGASYAVDNLLVRGYSEIPNHNVAFTSNTTDKTIATVNGIPFDSVRDALVFAAAVKGEVELTRDVTVRETLDVDGTVITNGFKLPFTAESNAALVTMDGDGDTVAKYVFDSSKNDIAISEDFVWYDNVTDAEDEDTRLPFKLGHTFEYYLPTETETHKIDIEWNSSIADYFGKVLTPELIDEINDVSAAEYDTYTITDKVNYKTNISFTSDFKVNVYVPYAAAMLMADLNTGADEPILGQNMIAIGDTYYMQLSVERSLLTINDTITVTFVYALKTAGVGTDVMEDTCELSIAEYVDTILSNESVSDADALLMYYMLNYVDAGFTYKGEEMPAELAALLSTATEKYEAITSEDKDAWGAMADANEYNTLAGTGIFEEVYIDLSDAAPKFVFVVKADFVGTVDIAYNAAPGEYLASVTYDDGDTTTDRTIVLDLDLCNFAAVLNVNGYLFNYAAYANSDAAAPATDLLNAFWAFIKYSALYVA